MRGRRTNRRRVRYWTGAVNLGRGARPTPRCAWDRSMMWSAALLRLSGRSCARTPRLCREPTNSAFLQPLRRPTSAPPISLCKTTKVHCRGDRLIMRIVGYETGPPYQTCSQCVRPIAGVTVAEKCLPKACSATQERLGNGDDRKHAALFSCQAISTHESQTLRVGVGRRQASGSRIIPLGLIHPTGRLPCQ